MVCEKSCFWAAGREVIVMNSRGGAEGFEADFCAVACEVDVFSSFL
jgi:hypothetical protein